MNEYNPLPIQLAPIKKGYSLNVLITISIIVMAISLIAASSFMQPRIDETYNIGLMEGAIAIANYTTLTGNFTYIENNLVQTMNINDYCFTIIQNLNNQGVEK